MDSNVIFPVISKNMPAYISMVGINYNQSGTERPLGFDKYQWIQTVSGCGILKANNSIYKINETTGFLLPPNLAHSYYPTNDKWIQNWIAFDGYIIEPILVSLGIEQIAVIDNTNELNGIIKSIFRSVKQNESRPTCSSIIKFLETVSEYKIQSHSRLSDVFTFIHNNYHKDVTLCDLSDILGVTPQYFCKLFTSETKKRPFDYINEYRISKSKELMFYDKKLSLSEIAALVGYNSSSYFCKIFHKIEGVSPNAFRKNLM